MAIDEKKPNVKAALDRAFAAEDDDRDEDDELETGADDGDQDDEADPDADPAPDDPEAEADPAQEGDDPDPDADPASDPDPDADPAPAADPAAAAAPGAAAEEEDWQPVTFRAGGRLMEIPGAARTKDGMFIPAEVVDQVLNTLQRGVHHDSTYQQEMAGLQRQLAERDPEVNEKVVEAAVVLDWLAPHLASGDAAAAFVANFAAEKNRLALLVDKGKVEARVKLFEKYPDLAKPAPAAPSTDEVRELAGRALVQHLDDHIDRGEFRGLFKGEHRKALEREIFRNGRLYVVTAPEDVPSEGIRKGEPAIDLGRLVEDIREYAKRIGVVRSPSAVPDAAARAVRANKAAARKPGKGPRKGNDAGRSSAPRGPRNKEEWLADVGQFARELSGGE